MFTARVRLLHMAPEKCIGDRLRALRNVDYLSADLDPARAMVGMDLTHIELPDDSFDVIIVTDVLEHIPADQLAMSELRRVLRPGGKAIVGVPIRQGPTMEDLSITDPAERARLYGQADHVRFYGSDGVLEGRLRAVGFDVTRDPIIDEMSPELRRRYRLAFALDKHGAGRYAPIYCCTVGEPVVPSPPTIGECATVGEGKVTVSWTAPLVDGGAPITGYVVTPYDGYAPLESVIFSSTATVQTISGLAGGTTYRFRVRAMNSVGLSSYSRTSNPVAPTQ